MIEAFWSVGFEFIAGVFMTIVVGVRVWVIGGEFVIFRFLLSTTFN